MITQFHPYTDGFHAAGNQLHAWVMQQALNHFGSDVERRTAVTDAASFSDYRHETRQRFLKSIGGLPEERTDLRTIETGRLNRKGYDIRKLIYQSQPGVYVTALLYQPDSLHTPAPGILMACGHARESKAAPAYQKVCIDLVRSGFVVLIIDPPGQGEMLQCLCRETGQPLAGSGTSEHRYLQISASIINRNIARDFLWNALRGIDLLCDLPEVDATRIGMTGNSGGGTLTQYAMLIDPRIRAAMPCCSVTTRKAYLEAGARSYDGEQNLFGAISDGVDYTDFLAAFAPRPLRVGAAGHDFFDIDGAQAAVDQARSIYRQLDAADAIDLCVADEEPHGYTTPLRRGCLEWFSRHLMECTAVAFDDEPEVEPVETLQCTASGQVLLEFDDARSLLDLYRAVWNQRRQNAPAPTRRELRERLRLPSAHPPLKARKTHRAVHPAGCSERLFFVSEPGILTTAVVYSPALPLKKAVLVIIPDGTEGQERYTKIIHDRIQGGEMVLVFDVRGTGAVRMTQRNPAPGRAFRSTEFRVASDHFLLGTSLASRRVYDVLRALEYLRSRPEVDAHTPIELIAHGWPAVYGLIAAALDGRIDTCSFQNLPASWSEAFEPAQPEPDRISEGLILPELEGRADIEDLLRLSEAS